MLGNGVGAGVGIGVGAGVGNGVGSGVGSGVGIGNPGGDGVVTGALHRDIAVQSQRGCMQLLKQFQSPVPLAVSSYLHDKC